MQRRIGLLLMTRSLPVVLLVVLLVDGVQAAEGANVDFNRDIRPILSDKCFRCHGPDAGERQTALRLDQQASAFAELDEGGAAVVPHDLAASQLWQRINAADPDVQMPPPYTGKSLTDDERERLRQWIEQGAAWGEHWAFVTPRRPRLPSVRQTDWVRNPIDTFVLARLEAAQLNPSPTALAETLVRRVTLDLTGLPPTPGEVDRFLADSRPDAYERLVDRLLQSPRYGEHRTRFWLDVARYGDTHGLHLDNRRSIWPYRDWVIRAFNRNQPFDEFTIDQLAGDLRPEPTLEQTVATGFNRCNVTTGEGGSIDQEYLVRYAVDRVETTATAWMGLTAGCAVCHDHKFDPISQTEFYQLFAYFFSVNERAMDGNVLLPPPSIKVPTLTQAIRQRRLQDEANRWEAVLEERRRLAEPHFTGWIEAYRQANPLPPLPSGAILSCPLDESQGDRVDGGQCVGIVRGTPQWDAARIAGGLRLDGKATVEFADVGSFSRTDAFSVAAWIYIDGEGEMTIASKMDDEQGFRGYDCYLSDDRLYVHLIHQWEDNAIRVKSQQPLLRQKWQHVCFTYDGSSQAAGISMYVDGQSQTLEITHDNLTQTIVTDQPFRLGRRRESAPFVGMLDEVRVYARQLSHDEVTGLAGADEVRQWAEMAADRRTGEQQQKLLDFFLSQRDEAFQEAARALRQAQDALRRLQGLIPSTLVMEEMTQPRQAYALVRGQYDQPGVAVEPGVPGVFPSLPADAPPNRLALARWLVNPNHPLTARVTVNRFWQQYFGLGLVATTEDFGSQGEWPSHPQLLDWLSVEFVESGWDIKALQRLIVTSATYRQSSEASAEQYLRDRNNRWLSRGPRFRMDAEMIRDNALAVSGLLVEQVGGDSVKPYQPPGLWEAVGYTSSNTAQFTRDDGPDLYRRSMYTFWKRTSPPPTMQIFDAPSREVCTVRRARTNTPSAALALMNDVQFVEAARQLATRLLREPEADDVQRLRRGFRRVTARWPNHNELQLLQDLLNEYRDEYSRDLAGARALIDVGEMAADESISPIELASWTLVASTLLNMDETITKW